MTSVMNSALALVMAAAMTAVGQPVRAEGDECIGLYLQRNRVYADAHYCFKTKEALAYFSNAGCIPGEPRLSPSQRGQLARITAEERRYNCRTQR
jgi:hypothetical protein